MACLFDGNDTTPTHIDHVLALNSIRRLPDVLQGVLRVSSSSFNLCGVEHRQAVSQVCDLISLFIHLTLYRIPSYETIDAQI
jgi:hypothetical protein